MKRCHGYTHIHSHTFIGKSLIASENKWEHKIKDTAKNVAERNETGGIIACYKLGLK